MDRLEFLQTHRRALHQIPELGLECELTATYLEKQLHAFGYETKRYAKTAVIAFKQGQVNQAIAFRSDTDALPIYESTHHDYVSKHAGHMHACGHDAHMSMLLALADELKDETLHKSILFIFQPGEEGPGGARVLIEEGLFKDFEVEAIFGLHVYHALEVGKIALVDGPMLAMSGEVIVNVEGKSSHAAAPHDGVDAILASTHLIQAYQSIVSRTLNPLDTCVVTIGTIHGGEAQNILAGHTQMSGTIRAFSEDVFQMVEKRMDEIGKGIETSHGVKVNTIIKRTYPPVINPHHLYEKVKNALDKDDYVLLKPMMFAEDFSFYQQELPGFFAMVGINGYGKGNFPLHHPEFDLDERALLSGVNYYKKIVDQFAR